MSEHQSIELPADLTFKKYIPVFTLICCIISVVLYVGINLEENPTTGEALYKWGAPSVIDIFKGSYWGLISSNFLHIEFWHIGFNLYWIWVLGKKIEFECNKPYFILLILSAALISSLSQLSFSNSTGIGLSGIAYALFGFIYIKSKSNEAYQNYLDNKIASLFFIWLIVGIILTKAKIVAIGNAAHVGGLLWGMLLAYLTKFSDSKRLFAGLSVIVIVSSSVYWNPFSTALLSYRAYELHKHEQTEKALLAYKEILERDNDNEFAKANIQQLEIYQLEKRAASLFNKQKYGEAKKLYLQILTIDKHNESAKANLVRINDETTLWNN